MKLHQHTGSRSGTTGLPTEVKGSGGIKARHGHVVWKRLDAVSCFVAQEEKEERRRKREAIVAPDVFSADGKGGRIVLYTQVRHTRLRTGSAREDGTCDIALNSWRTETAGCSSMHVPCCTSIQDMLLALLWLYMP